MTRRLILLISVFCLLLAGGTRDDITGTGVAVQVASSGGAQWVQFIADPGNTSAVRVADGSVSATRGARIAPGAGMLMPMAKGYSLANVYVYVASGDKVSVLWGN